MKQASSAARRAADELALAPQGYGVVDLRSGVLHEFDSLVAQLRWRNNAMPPREPRMPAHQYVVVRGLAEEDLAICRMFGFVVEQHAESYDGYFRGLRYPSRYLEVGDGWRYWRVWIARRPWPHRQRLDTSEPPRRVDEGAKPIPPHEWGAVPYWPQGRATGSGSTRTASGSSAGRIRRPGSCRRRVPRRVSASARGRRRAARARRKAGSKPELAKARRRERRRPGGRGQPGP